MTDRVPTKPRRRAAAVAVGLLAVALFTAGALTSAANAAEFELNLVNSSGEITLPNSDPLEIPDGQAAFTLVWDDTTNAITGSSENNQLFSTVEVDNPLAPGTTIQVNLTIQINPVGDENVSGELDPDTGEMSLESENTIDITFNALGSDLGTCTLGPTTVSYTSNPDWEPVPVDPQDADSTVGLEGSFALDAITADDCDVDNPDLTGLIVDGINGLLDLPDEGGIQLALRIGELGPPQTTTSTTAPPAAPTAPAPAAAPVAPATAGTPRFTG